MSSEPSSDGARALPVHPHACGENEQIPPAPVGQTLTKPQKMDPKSPAPNVEGWASQFFDCQGYWCPTQVSPLSSLFVSSGQVVLSQ